MDHQMFLALDKVGDGHLESVRWMGHCPLAVREISLFTQSSFDPIEGPLTPVEVVLLFDRSGHGTVTKEEFIATIIETYFNREKVWDSYMDRQQYANDCAVVVRLFVGNQQRCSSVLDRGMKLWS